MCINNGLYSKIGVFCFPIYGFLSFIFYYFISKTPVTTVECLICNLSYTLIWYYKRSRKFAYIEYIYLVPCIFKFKLFMYFVMWFNFFFVTGSWIKVLIKKKIIIHNNNSLNFGGRVIYRILIVKPIPAFPLNCCQFF